MIPADQLSPIGAIASLPVVLDERVRSAVEAVLVIVLGERWVQAENAWAQLQSEHHRRPMLTPLQKAVEAIMRGYKAFEFSGVDRNYLDSLSGLSDRFALQRVEGTRRWPEKGYRYRVTLQLGKVGARVALEVQPACDERCNARLTIEEIFVAGEFDEARGRMGSAGTRAGVSQAFVDHAIAMSTPGQANEQTLDFDPSPSFTHIPF